MSSLKRLVSLMMVCSTLHPERGVCLQPVGGRAVLVCFFVLCKRNGGWGGGGGGGAFLRLAWKLYLFK